MRQFDTYYRMYCGPYSAGVLHSVSDQIRNLQNCFTAPNKMTSEDDLKGLVSLTSFVHDMSPRFVLTEDETRGRNEFLPRMKQEARINSYQGWNKSPEWILTEDEIIGEKNSYRGWYKRPEWILTEDETRGRNEFLMRMRQEARMNSYRGWDERPEWVLTEDDTRGPVPLVSLCSTCQREKV
jgi:hypothetical protein